MLYLLVTTAISGPPIIPWMKSWSSYNPVFYEGSIQQVAGICFSISGYQDAVSYLVATFLLIIVDIKRRPLVFFDGKKRAGAGQAIGDPELSVKLIRRQSELTAIGTEAIGPELQRICFFTVGIKEVQLFGMLRQHFCFFGIRIFCHNYALKIKDLSRPVDRSVQEQKSMCMFRFKIFFP